MEITYYNHTSRLGGFYDGIDCITQDNEEGEYVFMGWCGLPEDIPYIIDEDTVALWKLKSLKSPKLCDTFPYEEYNPEWSGE